MRAVSLASTNSAHGSPSTAGPRAGPARSLATTGTPACAASTTARPKVSASDGKTKTSRRSAGTAPIRSGRQLADEMHALARRRAIAPALRAARAPDPVRQAPDASPDAASAAGSRRRGSSSDAAARRSDQRHIARKPKRAPRLASASVRSSSARSRDRSAPGGAIARADAMRYSSRDRLRVDHDPVEQAGRRRTRNRARASRPARASGPTSRLAMTAPARRRGAPRPCREVAVVLEASARRPAAAARRWRTRSRQHAIERAEVGRPLERAEDTCSAAGRTPRCGGRRRRGARRIRAPSRPCPRMRVISCAPAPSAWVCTSTTRLAARHRAFAARRSRPDARGAIAHCCVTACSPSGSARQRAGAESRRAATDRGRSAGGTR